MSTLLKDRNSPNPGQRSPRRLPTDPLHESSSELLDIRVHKRIVVCCDGTWQDGVAEQERSLYTNIIRFARAVNHLDERFKPTIPQIVFYQSGIGSDKNLYSRYMEGTTGGSLGREREYLQILFANAKKYTLIGDKVEEAYAFIAHNYRPGDEIFLFGFSRGAYVVRMIAMFIGEIGILDRPDMDHFASIFLAHQKLGECTDVEEARLLRQQLSFWNKGDSPGKRRANPKFSVKCLAVFDTVGSFGLPEELASNSREVRMIYGFPDRALGPHVERAYQALALNEDRADFTCSRFQQTEEGRAKHQILKQCWFTGSHGDIGGGYPDHDLSDLTLTWMAAQVGDILSLDLKYLASLWNPTAQWGQLKPHDPCTGIFILARKIERPIPTGPDEETKETIHASVLEQEILSPKLMDVIKKYPELVQPLLPLEEEVRLNWNIKETQVNLLSESLQIPGGFDANDSH